MNKKFFAILLIIISTFFATSMGAFIKLAQEEINVYTVGFLRFALGLIIISPYFFYTNFRVFKSWERSVSNSLCDLLLSCFIVSSIF